MSEGPSSDLAALDAITEAVESGAGLPEVVRAAGKALEASLAVTDAWGATLAVAARSPAEERALLSQGEGVSSIPLRVADVVVGTLHMRAKTEPSASMRRLLVTMIASEVERVRAPERVSETAAADFLGALLRRELTEREELIAQARGAVAGGSRWSEHDRRARPSPGAHRRGLARTRARGRRAWRAGRGQPLDRRPVRARRDGRRRGPAAGAGRRGAAGRARRRGGPARDGGRRLRATRSRSGAAGSRRIQSICRARSARRCSRRTSPRAAPTARRSPSSRPAPTGCC